MELPFELKKNHKTITKSNWKRFGLIMNNFNDIYERYIYASKCELCNKEFKNTKDRQMEHNHETGEFRNIVCTSCNQKKKDIIHKRNTSGYRNISKMPCKSTKEGFIWEFSLRINQKKKE